MRYDDDFVAKAKADYQKVGYAYCSALKENVYFNNTGWNHLLFKNGKPRKMSDMYRKLSLWIFAPEIIRKSSEPSKYTKDLSCEFWEFTKEFKERTVIVVVRRMRQGQPHFFSVKDIK